MRGGAGERLGRLWGYRAVLTGVGITYVFFSLLSMAQGAASVMEPFQLPEAVIGSPFYRDQFHWLGAHLLSVGVLFLLLGRCVEGARRQAVVAFTLLAIALHYGYLDFRTSPWGNGLYADPKALGLVAVDGFVVLALAVPCMSALRSRAFL